MPLLRHYYIATASLLGHRCATTTQAGRRMRRVVAAHASETGHVEHVLFGNNNFISHIGLAEKYMFDITRLRAR